MIIIVYVITLVMSDVAKNSDILTTSMSKYIPYIIILVVQQKNYFQICIQPSF